MVGVMVRRQDSREPHAILGQDAQEVGDPVRRIDGDRLAGLAVADQVHEVDHLGCYGVVVGEVPAGEQLAEVQAIGHACDRMGIGRPTVHSTR